MFASLALLLLLVLLICPAADADASAIKTKKKKEKKTIGEWQDDIGFYQAIRVTDESPILVKQSKYQTIEVHESSYYGKVLVLDGVLQLTERDADSYNEMMAQMPMMQHQNPKRALVIGGGDGYVLSEVSSCWLVACCLLMRIRYIVIAGRGGEGHIYAREKHR